MAAPWVEVTEGDMQREAENAYMFRRSFTKEFGYLCIQPGYAGRLEDDTVMECYARAANYVDWFCPSMLIAEFDTLEVEDVGVNPPPTNVDVPFVSQSGDRLTCTMGNWEGEPTNYRYVWTVDGVERGESFTNEISVTPVDEGKSATCVVTASNASGSCEAPVSNSHTITFGAERSRSIMEQRAEQRRDAPHDDDRRSDNQRTDHQRGDDQWRDDQRVDDPGRDSHA